MSEHPQQTARILRGVAGVYLLCRPHDEFRGEAMARGLFRKTGKKPLPGDRVVYEPSGDPDIPWVITDILPRKNELIRPPAANIDILIITASAYLPAADYIFIDRMLAYSAKHAIRPVLLLTKCDLPEAAQGHKAFLEQYQQSGIPLIEAGLNNEEGPEAVQRLTGESFAVLCGQSGVGKSTLMNRLLGAGLLETGSLSEKAGRGRQTTRSIEIYPLGDGWIADTPGFQSLDMLALGLEGWDIAAAYPELTAVAEHCRFHDCRHMGEPGCAVSMSGIHPERLERYRKLRKEADELKRY